MSLVLNLIKSVAPLIEKLVDDSPLEITPIGRDISDIPLVYQENSAINDCVACSVTWAQQFNEKNTMVAMPLSASWLAERSGTTQEGVKPNKVLAIAKNIGIATQDAVKAGNESACLSSASSHKVKDTQRIWFTTPRSLYRALLNGVVMVGTDDYADVGPHMMVAYDVSEDGTTLKCVNWWDQNVQQLAEIPFSAVNFAVLFASL